MTNTGNTLIMCAETDVQVGIKTARQWFLELKDHPERYSFSSHRGFTFITGDFGQVGARFTTIERFQGIPLKLTFELTGFTPTSFTFEVLKPLRGITDEFTLVSRSESTTTLSLSAWTRSKFIRQFFTFRPVYKAVFEQISAEVGHIKASMEQMKQP